MTALEDVQWKFQCKKETDNSSFDGGYEPEPVDVGTDTDRQLSL